MAVGEIERWIGQAEQQLILAQHTIERNWQDYVRAPLDMARSRSDAAAKLLAQAKQLYAAGLASSRDSRDSREAALQARNEALDSYLLALPSRAAEARGVWYRPTEQSGAEVCRTLDRMLEAGFNELYLETWFWGYTIYPSTAAAGYGVENQHPSFLGWDPLHVFAVESRKRGIALHAWLDGFMVGIHPTGGPVLRVYPEWGALARRQCGADRPQPQPGTGYYWLDITNPNVRAYLMAIMVEIITGYEIAGVNVDFIRLPHAADNNPDDSYCFSSHARRAFEKEHGVDPKDIDAREQPDMAMVWSQWLADIEDSFMSDMYRTLKSVRPHTIVSATPEPGAESDKIGQWSACVDVVIPQSYYASTEDVRASFVAHKAQLNPGNLVYTGIYPMYARMGTLETIEQVLAARDLDEGTVIFAFGQATSEANRALRLGPWRDKAISPGVYPRRAIRALLAAVVKDVEQSYIPRSGISDEAAAVLIGRLNDLLTASRADEGLDRGTDGLWAARIFELSEWLSGRKEAEVHPAVHEQLKAAFAQMAAILNYMQEKQILEEKEDRNSSQP
ncbi:family 10 glycosylhydrolase [Bacillus sp. 3255]|uniref:glycoside hydrolase family 10 protein n=1 Tax=Bacillus sp. 3255 TaxID=2817904 RepID=UPI0028646425|nr:family 10 glycosylhydrolase [Bacillus sp. 3255]MDR6879801.1 uncharacterized lipoprotein YddW (UPF0748 family) [Bacillus sp. 3255]